MEFPLENKDKCFKLNYPKCLGVRTKCPNLHECHNNFSGVLETGLLRTVDDDVRFWRWAFIVLIFLPPIILILFGIARMI